MAHTGNRQRERHVVRGMLTGAAGGLVASFAMNQFHEWLNKLTEKLPADDAIARAAISEIEKKSDPIVHYALASAIGALYGASVECSPMARTGLGTFLASALFVGADARRLVRSGMRFLT